MSNPSSATASNGQAREGRGHGGQAHGGRTVDWAGYPALFQRVAPTSRSHETIETPHEPAPISGPAGGIRGAFLGFCQAALFTPENARRFDRSSDSVAARRAIAAAEAFGLTRDELRQLGCGLYAGPVTVREDLRSLGFVDAEIDAARIVADESGRPRAELAGCLLVPLTDEAGHLCDFLLLTVASDGRGFSGYRFLYGPSKSNVVVYGLQTALSCPLGRESLVLVDDVLEALLLQCRGLTHVAAVGANGADLTPRRWEELARLGVATVTLAFRRDERHTSDIRAALVNALRARTAPQVFVANPYPGGERSAADVLRRFGKERCAAALFARSLAFYDKDFGAADRARPTPEPAPAFTTTSEPPRSTSQSTPDPTPEPAPTVRPIEPYYREAFRRHLADLVAALPADDRRLAEQVIAAVDRAVVARDWGLASWYADAAGTPVPHRPLPFAAWQGSYGYGGWTTPYTPAAWGFQPAWLSQTSDRTTAPSTNSPLASAAAASVVLDRLMKSPQQTEIPPHLTGFSGREMPSTVEWVVDSSARDRLATLCERVIDACERRPDQAFVIVCCEHSEQQIMLALATHLAARLSDGKGLTIEEVRTRFSGQEPQAGYRDKPWLADEAADRLRLWSSRLTFVTCCSTSIGRTAVENAVDAARAKSAFGGLYFDSLPNTGWYGATDPCLLAWLNELAARCGGQVFATAATAPVVISPPPPVAAWSIPVLSAGPWSTGAQFGDPMTASRLTQTAGGRDVLATLGDWLRREQETCRDAA